MAYTVSDNAHESECECMENHFLVKIRVDDSNGADLIFTGTVAQQNKTKAVHKPVNIGQTSDRVNIRAKQSTKKTGASLMLFLFVSFCPLSLLPTRC